MDSNNFLKLRKNNVFQDLRTNNNSRGVTGGKEASFDVLTHLGQPLYQLDVIDQEKTQFITNNIAEETEEHFGGIFSENEKGISVSTKTMMDNALKKIEMQKDEEKKLIGVFDHLETQWDVLKHNILKNKITDSSDINSLPDNDYFGLFTQFQASPIIYPNHRQHSNSHVNEAPKKDQIDIHRDSADMLCALPSTTEIKKPEYFIDPKDYGYSQPLQDEEIINIFSAQKHEIYQQSNDNILVYLKNDWSSELKKLTKNLKYRHFDQLISYLLNVPLVHELIQSIYEDILVFCRVHADYFEKRMTNVLKFIILDITSNKKITSHNNFLVLLMISRIAPTLQGIDRLFEAAFQIAVYFLYNNICTSSRALTFCGLVFEFCSRSNRYCPEVIIFFESFPNFEVSDIQLHTKYFDMVIQYMQMWSFLDNFSQIFLFTCNFSERIQSSSLSRENLIKIQVEKINVLYKTTKINFEQKNLLVKKQKFLKQYDPEIQLITPFPNESTAKHRSLKRLHKREFKGAVRKLRKDSVFNAQKQIEVVLRNDNERQNKLKKFYSQIAHENGSIM